MTDDAFARMIAALRAVGEALQNALVNVAISLDAAARILRDAWFLRVLGLTYTEYRKRRDRRMHPRAYRGIAQYPKPRFVR